MDFGLTADHQAVVAMARKFARDELGPGDRQRSIDGIFSHELWQRSGRIRLTGLPAEKAWGGRGCDTLATTLVIETLAQECEDLGFILSLCAHNFGCVVPLCRVGAYELKCNWLSLLASGKAVGAAGITESEAGSDVFSLTSHAVQTAEGFTINGRKLYVTNAPIADVFIIYARTEPASGAFGVSAFLIPKDTAGLTVEMGPRKSGLVSAPWGTVNLHNCHVPATAILGTRGAGAAVFHEAMRWERICLLAMATGATARMLGRCIERVRTRRQFGGPIGQFQVVANKVVDMRIALEASQLLLYRAAWLHSNGKPADEAIAISKIMAAESAVSAGIDAVQLFGAEGVISDMGIDLFLRDMLPLRILSGTSEMQRQIVARLMGLNHDASRRPALDLKAAP
jgi:L-prolyl-PCP dehydrogenase